MDSKVRWIGPSTMCRIYEVRPLICREFEMGAPDCVDERDKWFINLS